MNLRRKYTGIPEEKKILRAILNLVDEYRREGLIHTAALIQMLRVLLDDLDKLEED